MEWEKTLNKLIITYTNNIQLDLGFGEGVGTFLYKYISNIQQKEIFERAF
jgi:hypothetical protein